MVYTTVLEQKISVTNLDFEFIYIVSINQYDTIIINLLIDTRVLDIDKICECLMMK